MHFLQLEVVSILYQMSEVLFDVVHYKHDTVFITERPFPPLLLLNSRSNDVKQLSSKNILWNGCQLPHYLNLR